MVRKGLAIRVGDQQQASVLYDTESMQLRAVWQGRFIQFDPARFGLIAAPSIGGTNQQGSDAAWGLSLTGDFNWKPSPDVAPAAGSPKYEGLYLHGSRVALKYSIGSSQILESPSFEEIEGNPFFIRHFQVSSEKGTSEPFYISVAPGASQAVVSENANVEITKEDQWVVKVLPRPDSFEFKVVIDWKGSDSNALKPLALIHDAGSLEALRKGGSPHWKHQIVQPVLPGKAEDAYAIDTLSVPHENPWKALMFISGVDFFSNGDAAICTVHGDVWLVRGGNTPFHHAKQLTWKRFATGLYQPLGLKIVRDQIYVTGRDQITRLHDLNHDDEADFYQNFNNQIWTSADGHDYVACLETDSEGNFYTVSPRGVHRISADGKIFSTLAEGFRNPNGLGVGPGNIITVAPQEGNWTPASQVCEIKPGGFYGYGGPRTAPDRSLGYDAPLCWIPRPLDNSSGGQVWTPGSQFGPLQNQMIHLSFG
ncbi:MAG: DUF6797 domain-containing protein, partial [Verrucomicrobiales bacterium]